MCVCVFYRARGPVRSVLATRKQACALPRQIYAKTRAARPKKSDLTDRSPRRVASPRQAIVERSLGFLRRRLRRRGGRGGRARARAQFADNCAQFFATPEGIYSHLFFSNTFSSLTEFTHGLLLRSHSAVCRLPIGRPCNAASSGLRPRMPPSCGDGDAPGRVAGASPVASVDGKARRRGRARGCESLVVAAPRAAGSAEVELAARRRERRTGWPKCHALLPSGPQSLAPKREKSELE